MRWELHRHTGVDSYKERDYLEEAFVYLGRYAHFAIRDVEAMELPELERYILRVRKWVLAEHGKDENGNAPNALPTDEDKFT